MPPIGKGHFFRWSARQYDQFEMLGEIGSHETQISEHFNGRTRFDGDAPIFDSPLILLGFVNRSGSNLLADYLRQTRRFGGFHEDLNAITVKKRSQRLGEHSFPEFFQSLAAERLRRRKAFGVKASWQQIAMLLRWNIPAMFSGVRLVHITRHDSLAQAVSYHIADKTRAWTSENNISADDHDISFDLAIIRRLLVETERANEMIRLLSAVADLPYHGVAYDDLVKEPGRVVQGIADFCGCDLGGWVPDAPKLQKQANEINEQLVSEFCAAARAKMRLMH